MEKRLNVPIKKQPDELTCGPTCLYSVYQFFQDQVTLESVVNDVVMLEEGGTFTSNLASDALKRGYHAAIYSFNLQIFDPTWRYLSREEIIEKLEIQATHKKGKKLNLATKAYLRFLKLGGELRFEDLTPNLLTSYLSSNQPIIAGLSSTYLYQTKREIPATTDYDDIRGEPSGHFVILNGINRSTNEIMITDPYLPNPISTSHVYKVSIERLICSVLLGVVTYDANLLIISEKPKKEGDLLR